MFALRVSMQMSFQQWAFLQARGQQLINQLQRKLNLPRRSRRLADLPKPRPIHNVRRQPHVHNVKEVEELRPELQIDQFHPALALAKRRVFDQRKIEVVVRRPAEGIAPQRSESSLFGPVPSET